MSLVRFDGENAIDHAAGMAMTVPFGGLKDSSTQTFKEQAGPSMMLFYLREKSVYITP